MSKRLQVNCGSLLKMTHAMRTFSTQSEALKYIAEQQMNKQNFFTVTIIWNKKCTNACMQPSIFHI
jgi:hypothetical protein